MVWEGVTQQWLATHLCSSTLKMDYNGVYLLICNFDTIMGYLPEISTLNGVHFYEVLWVNNTSNITPVTIEMAP